MSVRSDPCQLCFVLGHPRAELLESACVGGAKPLRGEGTAGVGGSGEGSGPSASRSSEPLWLCQRQGWRAGWGSRGGRGLREGKNDGFFTCAESRRGAVLRVVGTSEGDAL